MLNMLLKQPVDDSNGPAVATMAFLHFETTKSLEKPTISSHVIHLKV